MPALRSEGLRSYIANLPVGAPLPSMAEDTSVGNTIDIDNLPNGMVTGSNLIQFPTDASPLRWEAVNLQAGLLHVHRIKNGQPAVHSLRGPELPALRQVRRHYPDTPYLFVSERGGPLTARAVCHIVLRAGEVADLTFPIHPHMLRHACGFYLANKGTDTRTIQQYLGHRNIQHTVRYTVLTPHRFSALWDD